MSEEKNLKTDTLLRATAADGGVRCMAAVTTNLVAEAVERHQTSPTVAAALGRMLTGTLLLGAGLKELDRLTVQIVCDGPVGGITAEANAGGQVRGYARNPDANPDLNGNGKFDVSSIVGKGMFYVTYESGYEIGLYKDPYRGSVPIVSGEIGEDFAYYLAKSEQIPSAVPLGVYMRARESGETFVEAAGGMMIQVMPGADEKIIDTIEDAVRRAPHTTTLIREGARAVDMLRATLGDLSFEVLEEKPVSFTCQCSYERAHSLISSIDREELETILREDRGAAMTCHFCNETYRLDEATLENILAVRNER
ncbi:MAG TPA: Hsp33 family molecular chaperone HslO [Pyrinomonadaceae bacterium]|nr:Hsp33 family molecular chaperone HslO [Pyrinomonadaceae bacterium]